MIGEKILNIYGPKSDGWFVIHTDKSFYSLRLGGIKTESTIDASFYNLLDIPVLNKAISKIYSDDFCVYIETADGDAIIHSPNSSIDSTGNTYFGIEHLPKDSFEELKKDYNSDGKTGFWEI